MSEADVENEEHEVIIVAEDSAPNRAILVHLLRKLNYDVVECADGESAWEETQRLLDEDTNIVAILSDIMMPNMDGIEYLEECRNHEKAKDIPFVLVTAVSDKDHVLRAKDLGVSGYIVKPVSFQRVLNKLKELFPQKTFPALAS